MKKYFMLLAAAATVLAVSCNKEKEQPKVDPTPGTEIEDNTPQPVTFGVSSVEVKSPITKAAVENTTAWPAGSKLYIYGFKLNNGTPTITAAAALLDNVSADAPNSFTNYTPALNGNQREAIVVEKANHEPYYYGTDGEVYNFYGYYGGTATIAPAIDGGKVSAAVTIDGSQDIMLATTDKFADYIAANSPNVSLDKVYSEVSARKNVKPDLKFKHQLARFKFETKYGGATVNDGANIMIDTLYMKSLKAGTLTIAAADEANIGFVPTGNWASLETSDTLILRNADGSRAKGTPGNGNDQYNVYKQLGESIMTFPQGMTGTTSPKYTVHIGITQNNGTANGFHFCRDLDIDFATVVDRNGDPIINKYAEAGKMYVIRLVIYGAEEIKMTVSLEDWEYGGETEIDPDQDPRPVPTLTITAPDPSATLNLVENATQQITATATYGTPAESITAFKYGTTNKKVATVSATGEITAVKAGDCKVYVYVEATGNYQGVMQAIDVHVTAAAPALPVPVFAGLPAAAITTNDVSTASYTTVAVFSTCQYGTTPADVDASDISIEVKDSNQQLVATGFNLNNDKTITVASGTATGDYSVTLKVAASANYQATSATAFTISVVNSTNP